MKNLIKRTAPSKVIIDAEFSVADMYAALEWYYHNNGLYALLQQDLMAGGLWTEGMVGLRNPAHRVVEFYVAKLWGGPLAKALPIVTEQKNIVDPIQQVWAWSNWGAAKQVAARWFAMYGDMFIKVATNTAITPDGKPTKVYFQNIKPMYVTDFNTDERGYLTWVRIDVPQRRTVDGKSGTYYLTEIWDKIKAMFWRWETDKGPSVSEDRLGTPVIEKPLSDYGIDFIPIVHAKFQDIGEAHGMGAFTHALDKIDEANRMATRLHELLYQYNQVVWAITAGGADSAGRPLPAPMLKFDGQEMSADGTTTIGGGQKVARLPGNSELKSLVPDLHYDDALAVLQDHMKELERDLPEIAYFRLREEKNDLSGTAIRYLLSDAVDKVIEARGNAEAALARADAMALTIGKTLGIFQDAIGKYENGDFEHTFADRDVIPLSQKERREIAEADLRIGASHETVLTSLGYDAEDEMAKRAEENKNAGDGLLSAFEKGQV